VQQLDAAGQIVFDAEVILKYKANCDWRQAAALRDLNSLYAEWRDWKTADDGISGATYIDKFIAEIATYLDGTCKEKDMFRGFTDSVRTISEQCFCKCFSLERISNSENLKTIETEAFSELMMMFISDAEFAAKFVNGIVPASSKV
jgi:hypothetical protein